jgi:hypothetical protein
MEPTLSLKKDDLESLISDFLGYGFGSVVTDDPTQAWTDSQQRVITEVRHSAERQFYSPPAIPELRIPAGYRWSFIQPVANLTLHQNTPVMPMPDDFGGIEGQITISIPAGVAWFPVRVGSIGDVYDQTAKYPTTTGRPWLCCVEAIKGTGPFSASRQQLHFWPIPDQEYTLRFRYYLCPDAMTDANPYVYGGTQHADTIKASCLAVAEVERDDMVGVRNARWLERLAASVAIDRRSKPQTYGYNSDRSDKLGRRTGPFWHGYSAIEVNGVVPGV